MLVPERSGSRSGISPLSITDFDSLELAGVAIVLHGTLSLLRDPVEGNLGG